MYIAVLNMPNLIANFLIMGDAGWETEYKLLMQQYPDLEVDVIDFGASWKQT